MEQTKHARWSPAIRQAFLIALAQNGEVRAAAGAVGFSAQSAYRQRARDPAFADAWDAARIAAREVVLEEVVNRALNGYEEEVWFQGELRGHRIRFDNRLLLALLGRLDAAAGDAARGGVSLKARRAAGRIDQLIAAVGDDAPLDPCFAPTEAEVAWEALVASDAAHPLADEVERCRRLAALHEEAAMWDDPERGGAILDALLAEEAALEALLDEEVSLPRPRDRAAETDGGSGEGIVAEERAWNDSAADDSGWGGNSICDHDWGEAAPDGAAGPAPDAPPAPFVEQCQPVSTFSNGGAGRSALFRRIRTAHAPLRDGAGGAGRPVGSGGHGRRCGGMAGGACPVDRR
jgi:hypothetical protein